MNLLELRQVTLQRGGHTLIIRFSSRIVAGRITVIMGPNGVGKSSLLLALAGMIPTAGEIILRGSPLNEYSRAEIAHEVAWQGDLPPTEFGLTVMQRLQLACSEVKREQVRKGTVYFLPQFLRGKSETVPSLPELSHFLPAAELMEVDNLLDRVLGNLSSGERQRVELAALMLRDTHIWLLDEPTAHLDLRHQMTCLNMLRCQAEHGRTIVVVLHDIQQAMSIADDVVLLDSRGHIETGSATKMLTQKHLQAVFKVPLHATSLLPNYLEKQRDCLDGAKN